MVTTEISPEIKGFLEWEVSEILIPEGNDFALGDEECELVFSGLVQFAELDACDFGSDAWCEFLDLASFWEEIFEGRIGVFAVVYVREWFPSGIFLAMIPSWEVGGVLFYD